MLLDVDPAVGLERVASRGAADRLESESIEFHERVRYAFLDLAAADPKRYLVLDASGDRDALAQQVRERIGRLLPSGATPATRTGQPAAALTPATPPAPPVAPPALTPVPLVPAAVEPEQAQSEQPEQPEAQPEPELARPEPVRPDPVDEPVATEPAATDPVATEPATAEPVMPQKSTKHTKTGPGHRKASTRSDTPGKSARPDGRSEPEALRAPEPARAVGATETTVLPVVTDGAGRSGGSAETTVLPVLDTKSSSSGRLTETRVLPVVDTGPAAERTHPTPADPWRSTAETAAYPTIEEHGEPEPYDNNETLIMPTRDGDIRRRKRPGRRSR